MESGPGEQSSGTETFDTARPDKNSRRRTSMNKEQIERTLNEQMDEFRDRFDKCDVELEQVELGDMFFTAGDLTEYDQDGSGGDTEDEEEAAYDMVQTPKKGRKIGLSSAGRFIPRIPQCRRNTQKETEEMRIAAMLDASADPAALWGEIQEWAGPDGAPRACSSRAVPRVPFEELLPQQQCPSDPSEFKLRIGPNYKKNGFKAPSDGSMYVLLGKDVFRSEHPIKNIASKMQLPVLPYETNSPSAPQLLIMNVQLPIEKPSLIGQNTNGPTVNLVLTYAMTPETAIAFKETRGTAKGLPPALQLLEEWSVRSFEDDAFRGRLKWIVQVQGGLPSALSQFNGKPILITGSGTNHRGPNYIMVDCNISKWCFLARATLYGMWSALSQRRWEMGATIEAREDKSMPEKLLGCARFAEDNLDEVPSWEGD